MRYSLLILIIMVPFLLYAQSGEKAVQETYLGFSKIVDMNFKQALTKVKAELKKEGFGVLTEIDVKAVMKKKLDVDYKPYMILGVCNPPLAHKSIMAEEQIGLMLPCKFIVYVNKEDQTVVAAVDPAKMMAGLNNNILAETAKTVQKKFKKVMNIL
jgi:uncharacterized protein (DUF302 family)